MFWGRPCIFLCNENEDRRLDGTLDTDSLLRNCIFVVIKESLYQNADGTLADVYVPEANVPPVPACGIELDFLTVWIGFGFGFGSLHLYFASRNARWV